MKYSLKKQLQLLETSLTRATAIRKTHTHSSIATHPLYISLAASASAVEVYSSKAIIQLHHAGNCISELVITLDDETDSGGIWVDKIETLNAEGELDASCFKQGYAKQMLTLLVQAADETQTPLVLIAAPEAYQLRQMPGLPDKDALAALYSRYGFVVTSSNWAQIRMARAPVLS